MNKKRRVALITGVTGQDGSYLTELLLSKGYTVFGLKRRTSVRNTSRIEHLLKEQGTDIGDNFSLLHGDLTDGSSLARAISISEPDEVYNLAAQSHVRVSFEEPEYTANSDALGTLRILEILRNKAGSNIKFYQASTSELYGGRLEEPYTEDSPMEPMSPYAAAKLYAHNITRIYRDGYGLFASTGILFNHESPRRGENFVTQKIVQGLVRLINNDQSPIQLGNLDAKRDWGHARDYVYAQWLILQHPVPKDFVIATGMAYSVRDFIKEAFGCLGVSVSFRGRGIEEEGFIDGIVPNESSPSLSGLKLGQVVITINPGLFRPLEVNHLLGDAKRARDELGWSPNYSFSELVSEMVFDALRMSKISL